MRVATLLFCFFLATTNGAKYVVTLKNECPTTILTAAFGPSAVYPDTGMSFLNTAHYKGDWALESGKSLNIRIPHDWLSTQSGWHPGHHEREANGNSDMIFSNHQDQGFGQGLAA